ncbi:MAG TPA: sulfite exporter TauE/SafE family protein [Chitinophagaceae bacterium]|mgnify:CR=1 FL=1|nr:MAG: Sulfite exporter TauE/SafE [Bacteroidetes bacterium OLB11]HMN32340.1 sulfite exporter TauE/SafE family protein [Chitinophagaceae bacterium]
MTTLIILILIGFTAGVFSGMIGIGGGIILIPALIYFLKLDQHTAQGTSLAIMLPPIGLFAAYNYYKAGHINIYYAIVIALAFMVGGYFGSAWVIKLSPAILKKIFSVVLILIAIKMLFSK